VRLHLQAELAASKERELEVEVREIELQLKCAALTEAKEISEKVCIIRTQIIYFYKRT